MYAAGTLGADDHGYDYVTGGNGNDFLYEGTEVDGGPGNDTFEFLGGGADAFGGDGNDIMKGSPFSDYLAGGLGADSIFGNGDDDDRLTGGYWWWDPRDLPEGDGADDLYGGHGNDSIDSVDTIAGNDALFGDLGTDVCDADAGDTVVTCP